MLDFIVEEKRSKILNLLKELEDENDSGEIEMINSEKELCEVAKAREKQVEKMSQQLKLKVMERRRAVLRLLQSLATEEKEEVPSPHEEKETVPLPEKTRKVKTKSRARPRVAGTVDTERCSRCEQLEGEQVCGGNGKTYTTLCHAVNCAGIAMTDIMTGPCIDKVSQE